MADPHDIDADLDKLGVDEDTWTRGRVWGLSALLPAPEDITEQTVAELENLLADR
ncbi:MAG: hypothetical protein WBA97_03200 [Actinophytocola sp.]|uniref:hypothetical protein n=1 Tax=Actinophytocola sp. TaxID=1872138 RepID=UPI003C736C82